MKVLEATDFYFPWIAGPAPLVKNLSLGLLDRGHEVMIACPSPTGERHHELGPPEALRVRTWPVPVGHNLRVGAPFLDLLTLVTRWRPDIVHIHHPFPISLAALTAAKMRGVPIVATNHTIPECSLYGARNSPLYPIASRTFGAYLKFLLRGADDVVTPTKTAANMLRRLGFRSPVRAVSNGVDTERFQPRARTSNDVPEVLFTGRLDAEKDLETLIRAVPFILKRVQVRVRIHGEGSDRRRLEHLVATSRLEDVVQFTSYVAPKILPTVYQEADVYAMPSRVELQSISTLEAMACGLPVVAADAGALPELVQPELNGYLAEPGNPQSLASGIERLLLDPAMRLAMGRASRDRAERHGLQSMVAVYEQIFERLIGEYVPGPLSPARATAG